MPERILGRFRRFRPFRPLFFPSEAFTLIELLIVVAIIAILAAIAIPNFLEAQTRAKVVRSKTNLRLLSETIEAYRVDTGAYPPDASSFPGGGFYLERLTVLTTPVAYLSAVPADPYVDAGTLRRLGATNPYACNGVTVYPLTYDYAYRRAPDGTPEPDSVWEAICMHPEQVEWAMRGLGPEGTPKVLGDLWPAYDPTNGTYSRGNIYWTGPGGGEDQPKVY